MNFGLTFQLEEALRLTQRSEVSHEYLGCRGQDGSAPEDDPIL